MSGAGKHSEPTYRLSRPACSGDWCDYHRIRRDVAFAGDDEEGEDPAGSLPGCHPLLLCLDGEPVGTIQIDILETGEGALRLVAIDPARQGRGHGRALLREAEAFARELGCRRAVVYATPDAAGFYASAGYAEDAFDEQYFSGVVQMTKPLHYAGFVPPDL